MKGGAALGARDVMLRVIVSHRVAGHVSARRKHWLVGQLRGVILGDGRAACAAYTIEIAEVVGVRDVQRPD